MGVAIGNQHGKIFTFSLDKAKGPFVKTTIEMILRAAQKAKRVITLGTPIVFRKLQRVNNIKNIDYDGIHNKCENVIQKEHPKKGSLI